MDKQRAGNIINISSGAGRRGYPLRSPYAAAKWAMIGLTQTMAGEWGQRGIRCNCICPGAIEGDRIERVMRARAEALEQPYEQIRAGFLSQRRDAPDGDGGRSRARRAVPRARHVGGSDRSDDQRRLRQHHELSDALLLRNQRAMSLSRTVLAKAAAARRRFISSRASTGERWRPPVHPRPTVR